MQGCSHGCTVLAWTRSPTILLCMVGSWRVPLIGNSSFSNINAPNEALWVGSRVRISRVGRRACVKCSATIVLCDGVLIDVQTYPDIDSRESKACTLCSIRERHGEILLYLLRFVSALSYLTQAGGRAQAQDLLILKSISARLREDCAQTMRNGSAKVRIVYVSTSLHAEKHKE